MRRTRPVRRRIKTIVKRRHRAYKRVAGADKGWWKRGYDAGIIDAGVHAAIKNEGNRIKALNQLWINRFEEWFGQKFAWSRYFAASQGYLKGFCNRLNIPVSNSVFVPVRRSFAAIVTAMNEEGRIGKVLEQLSRLPFDEIIVIVNGSRDRTFRVARNSSRAVILHYPNALGHDVGRGVGAGMAQSDILLFLDGDIPVKAERLVPFLYEIERGRDVALNDITPYLPVFSRWDKVTILKQFLNRCLNRPDLFANSMTAVPHALSRRAVNEIGYQTLMIPPKAQTKAILQGLSIGAAASVNVIKKNRKRTNNTGTLNAVEKMIIGDHVEALDIAMKNRGFRLAFPDHLRKRDFLGGGPA